MRSGLETRKSHEASELVLSRLDLKRIASIAAWLLDVALACPHWVIRFQC